MKALWNTWVIRYDFGRDGYMYIDKHNGEWRLTENPDWAQTFATPVEASRARSDMGDQDGVRGTLVKRVGKFRKTFEEAYGVPPLPEPSDPRGAK